MVARSDLTGWPKLRSMQSRRGAARSRRFTALFEGYLFTRFRIPKSAPQTQTLLTDSRQNAGKE